MRFQRRATLGRSARKKHKVRPAEKTVFHRTLQKRNKKELDTQGVSGKATEIAMPSGGEKKQSTKLGSIGLKGTPLVP